MLKKMNGGVNLLIWFMICICGHGGAARGNQSAIHLHHFKGYEFDHTRNCGYATSGSYLSHANMSHLMGWSTPNNSQQLNYNTQGYDRLFEDLITLDQQILVIEIVLIQGKSFSQN